MWIDRELSSILGTTGLLEAVLVQGPRQVGKTSLLEHFVPPNTSMASLDDLAIRERAMRDPALFFTSFPSPVVIDEVQYAPNLFPEVKRLIDKERSVRRSSSKEDTSRQPLFYLSGSNQIEIDLALKETLAGRVSILSLHGLSVSEALKRFPSLTLNDFLWKGGFPELYVRNDLSARDYINDYISTFIEKDIARSGGVTKINEFLTVIRLLAARVAGVLNRESLANDAGVAAKTVSEWIDLLVRTQVVHLLPVYSSNLNSRLTKSPKVYFLDSGLATRLQGHLTAETILASPQAGALFENLVIAEVIKTRDHNRLPCSLSFWRTREKEELDLLITVGREQLFLECKLAIQGTFTVEIPASLKREFGDDVSVVVVTAGGTRERISDTIERVPLFELGDFIQSKVGLVLQSRQIIGPP